MREAARTSLIHFEHQVSHRRAYLSLLQAVFAPVAVRLGPAYGRFSPPLGLKADESQPFPGGGTWGWWGLSPPGNGKFVPEYRLSKYKMFLAEL